ncbi:HNH endonuclease signature motif containing protein [Planococcus versutus]|uniref:HNH nuclease domain-containing protein n=1 Tax=Planococcus versutus TaxID=1302659 RepID=A0A1B1S5I2_9BACL|nr:HNH endonuclease signature motif containing protein [Planococcus versutus]ANU28444.1 hypothetical protein I858_015750 [Planococcus versutus]
MGSKFITFYDLVYTLDEKTGYYLNSTKRKRLHRSIWEHHNGEIPEGYHIHHIDGNKNNNDISNLECMPAKEHAYLHGKYLENILKMKRIQVEGQKKAAEWHKSAEGSEWHKQHYEKHKASLYKTETKKCKYCGIDYEVVVSKANLYCSNKCKSKARRESGVDDVTKNCEFCGTPFTSNKYQKKRFCTKSCSNKGVVRLPQLKNKDAL